MARSVSFFYDGRMHGSVVCTHMHTHLNLSAGCVSRWRDGFIKGAGSSFKEQTGGYAAEQLCHTQAKNSVEESVFAEEYATLTEM